MADAKPGPDDPSTPTTAAPGGAADEERAWWQAELTRVVTSRRTADDDLDRAKAELAAARLEMSQLAARRSVRLALAVADALRPLRSIAGGRSRPRKGGMKAKAVVSAAGGAHRLTPAEFRAHLQDRLRRPDELKVARIDRADPARPGPDDIAWADIAIVTTPDFDARTLRGGAVSVAIVGPDAGPWLDRPWLDDFDIVATASAASVDAITADRAAAPVLVTDPLADVNEMVGRWVAARRFGIAIGVPSWDEGVAWGDLHYARAVQRQLERAGHPARIQIRPEWTDAVSARDDASLHLFGLSGRTRLPGQLTLLWIISHPERVSDELLAGADRIYVASDSFARDVAGRASAPVAPLHQATDAQRFRPDPTGPHHDVLFVGNSRGVRREILADLVPTTLDLAVYGQWPEDRLDPAYHKGDFVPNEELHRYYSSAAVVLNDHWPEMRAAGFFSNRLYDALAAGACVVSDHVPGIEDEFDSGVATYSDAGNLRLLLHELVRDPGRRRALAERGRAAVLARHTFEHRVPVILADVAADLS